MPCFIQVGSALTGREILRGKFDSAADFDLGFPCGLRGFFSYYTGDGVKNIADFPTGITGRLMYGVNYRVLVEVVYVPDKYPSLFSIVE